MMIPVIIQGQFKPSPAFAQFQFLKKPHVGQQAQGAIHRGQGHLHLQSHQFVVHVLGAEVTAGSPPLEQLKNPLTLRGQTTAVLVQALLQGSLDRSR